MLSRTYGSGAGAWLSATGNRIASRTLSGARCGRGVPPELGTVARVRRGPAALDHNEVVFQPFLAYGTAHRRPGVDNARAFSSKAANAVVRNVGIMAHIDAGKTTVTERILYYANVTRQFGEALPCQHTRCLPARLCGSAQRASAPPHPAHRTLPP